MAIKKYLLVFEAYSGDKELMFKGNAASQIDNEKHADEIGRFFVNCAIAEAKASDSLVKRVVVTNAFEI